MSKTEFVADDFWDGKLSENYLLSPSHATICANAKLKDIKEQWMKELKADSIEVFGEKMPSTGAFVWTGKENTFPAENPHVLGATNRAFIPKAFIEEIVKKECQHEPTIYFHQKSGGTISDPPACRHCGKVIKCLGWELNG